MFSNPPTLDDLTKNGGVAATIDKQNVTCVKDQTVSPFDSITLSIDLTDKSCKYSTVLNSPYYTGLGINKKWSTKNGTDKTTKDFSKPTAETIKLQKKFWDLHSDCLKQKCSSADNGELACVGNAGDSGHQGQYGCKIDISSLGLKGRNSTGDPVSLNYALLSLGHGTMNNRNGDMSILSNGSFTVINMSVGTRSWSTEMNSPTGTWLACGSPLYNTSGSDKGCTGNADGDNPIQPGSDAPTDSCPAGSTQGIQPWVQDFTEDQLDTIIEAVKSDSSKMQVIVLPADK